MNKFSIHEDDFFQCGIFSSNKFEELRIQAENTQDFSVYGKFDYSKVDFENEKRNSIQEMKISIPEFESLLNKYELNKFPKVYSGYAGNFNNKLKNTVAFGNEKNAFIYEYEKGILKNLWIYNNEFFNENILNSILSEFGKKWNLLLFDHQEYLVELKDSKQIKKYLEKLKN